MFSIAIDGPAGAGKSSVCFDLAQLTHFIHVDTGALYRAIGLYVLSHDIDCYDADSIEKKFDDIHIDLRFLEDGQHIYLNGDDVSGLIRTPEVSTTASAVSSLPPVRAFLLNLQRDLANRYNVIMDGRDIGTVVLPNATLKIFLTASAEVRAKRRYIDQINAGIDEPFEMVLKKIEDRDYQDSHRSVAPMVPANDAIILDSTDLTKQEVVEIIHKLFVACAEEQK